MLYPVKINEMVIDQPNATGVIVHRVTEVFIGIAAVHPLDLLLNVVAFKATDVHKSLLLLINR